MSKLDNNGRSMPEPAEAAGVRAHVDTLAVNGVTVHHNFGGGVYAKETQIPAGVVLTQHTHPHDHLSILAQGIAMVEADGERRTLIGPCCITIKAGAPHKVTAHTPVVWYCIHATEDTDPATVDTSVLSGACCG
jgi:quercetin dioxygenase-like cupin family protein